MDWVFKLILTRINFYLHFSFDGDLFWLSFLLFLK